MTRPTEFIVTVPLRLPYDLVKSALISAVEGGINYWADAAEPQPKRITGDLDFYDLPLMSGLGYGWRIHEIESNDSHNPEGAWHYLDRAALERAIALMAQKYPHHFADFIESSGDACTADVLVQLAVFGELVYG